MVANLRARMGDSGVATLDFVSVFLSFPRFIHLFL
jgi:hypothetical protein